MTKASDNVFSRFLISEGGSTATPASATVTVYAKADGLLYSKDDAGTETLVSGGAGSGAVATDAIWDAAGDLAVGSGANTAAKLTAGSEGEVLTIASGVPSWEAASGAGVSSCLANRTTNQTVTGSPTTILFDAADIYDPDGWHDPAGANPERLTCPTGIGGKVFTVSVTAEWNHAAAIGFRLRILKNGTVVSQSEEHPNQSYTATLTALIHLADADYVTAVLFGPTSGAIIQTDAPTTFGVMG